MKTALVGGILLHTVSGLLSNSNQTIIYGTAIGASGPFDLAYAYPFYYSNHFVNTATYAVGPL